MEKETNIYCNCEAMYLDYFNNFLTVSAFAEYYGLSEKEAFEVIAIGKKHNNI